ncbi:hypothetical protein [Candidatus Leptofilum sp.]|uniref:hypothetical protein n=1 Tax=Candidatus Leptofilum sp. TaxID=3241576 RepID=UPI003B5AF6AA
MFKKKTAILILSLISVLAVLILVQTDRLYLSQEKIVNETIVDLLAENQQRLPTQQADLAMLHQNPNIALKEITRWEATQIELENSATFFQAIFDDDPIYRLQAALVITFADGNQATLTWESWRYGLVIGPAVVSMGDGPPGFITAVAER